VTIDCNDPEDEHNRTGTEEKRERSDVMVLTEPLDLRRQVAVQNIAFFILETPWNHDKRISFTYPGSFLDLSFDPSHPGDTIDASDSDMIRPEQGIRRSELLFIPSLGQPDAGSLNP
jgi:hypothetical protein